MNEDEKTLIEQRKANQMVGTVVILAASCFFVWNVCMLVAWLLVR